LKFIKISLPKKTFGVLPRKIKTSLNASIFDGYLWAMMWGLGEMFVIPFAVFFQASSLMVSLINGLTQIGISISNVLGANFIEYYRNRKKLAIITNILHASSYLFIFFFTLITKDPAVILIFFVAGLVCTSFSSAGWTSWMNELVPERIRGRFWGLRNKYINLFQIIAALIGGAILSLAKKFDITLFGFGFLFISAFFFRAASFIPLSKQYEPTMAAPSKKERISFFDFIFSLPKSNFGRFTIFNIFFTLSTSLMPALTTIFLLKTIKVSYLELSIINIALSLSSAFLMPYWGKITDNYGNYKVLAFTACGILLIPLGWTFFRETIWFIILNIFAGFFWSGFALSSQNFILDNVDKRVLHYNVAYYNALNNFMAFVGSVLGGILAKAFQSISLERFLIFTFTESKLEIVFFISFILRLIIIVLLLKTFTEIKRKKPLSNTVYIFIIQPAIEYLNPVKFISTAAQHYVKSFKLVKKFLSLPKTKDFNKKDSKD